MNADAVDSAGRSRIAAVIVGRVQGVGFRYAATRTARRLGLTGFVRNVEDGSVETVAEGNSDDIRRYLAWIRTGPPGAVIKAVQVRELPYMGEFDGFATTW